MTWSVTLGDVDCVAMATPAQEPRPIGSDDSALLRISARRLAESVKSNAARLRFAHHLIFRTTEHYWQAHAGVAARLRRCFVARQGCTLSSEAETIARQLGALAAGLDPVDAAYVIGRTYAASLPADVRTDLGVYYTPPQVAERLLNQAERAGIDWRRATVLDPACGGGAFLAPVARRMALAMKRADPDRIIASIEARLCGYEVDAFSGWMSQVFVDAILLEISTAAGRACEPLVSVRDTLDAPPRAPGFDLVIGNPPYGRSRLAAERRARYARSLYGHANLYGLFTDYALQSAGPNGVICYVTPTSFLGGEYFKSLRSVLARDAPPDFIDFLAVREGVFDDVLQETLLVVYRKGVPRARVRVSSVEPTASGLGIHDVGTFRLPAAPESPWVLPRARGEARVAKRLGELRYRLRDWGYSVSTGPLVWNRYKSQLRDSPGPRCIPLIWAEAVGSDGVFRFRAEKKNHAPYFRVLPGDGSLLVNEPCVLIQRTTAKEQHRRLIAAELPATFLARHGHVTVENHVNMVRPLPRRMFLEGASHRHLVAPRTLAAFLNTQVADRAFRCLSGSVAVSAFELESLPLPDPEALGPVVEALSNGASGAEIERLCSKLYGF